MTDVDEFNGEVQTARAQEPVSPDESAEEIVETARAADPAEAKAAAEAAAPTDSTEEDTAEAAEVMQAEATEAMQAAEPIQATEIAEEVQTTGEPETVEEADTTEEIETAEVEDGPVPPTTGDDLATRIGAELDTMEAELGGENVPSFKRAWDRVRQTGDTIRGSADLAPHDRHELQRRLNAVVRDLRRKQREFHDTITARRAEILEALQLAAEAIPTAQNAADLNEVRADLALIRERVTGFDRTFPRAVRTELWEIWQNVNRAAWEALVLVRQENEAQLGALLDEVDALLAAGQTRKAREQIKVFHQAITAQECSRAGARTLRQRAATLWEATVERGREQHQRYVEASQRRLRRAQETLRNNERERHNLRNELIRLERLVESSSTGVAHALARGQLAEAQKALHRLETEDVRVRTEIAEAEGVVGESATPAPSPEGADR